MVDDHRHRDPACVGGRTHGVDRFLDHFADVDRTHLEAELPGDDPRDVEQIFDQLRLYLGVPLDRLEGAGDVRVGQGAGAKDARPAEDGVERRAELVRQHGEEFVLQPVRFFCRRER
jgi:hypothetical protein